MAMAFTDSLSRSQPTQEKPEDSVADWMNRRDYLSIVTIGPPVKYSDFYKGVNENSLSLM